MPDAVEDEIAELVSLPVECSKNPRGSSVGQVIVEEGLDKLYIDHVIAAAPCKLNGLKVVMDCSNGANSVIAPVILRSLGVEVVTIFNQPNKRAISRPPNKGFLLSAYYKLFITK